MLSFCVDSLLALCFKFSTNTHTHGLLLGSKMNVNASGSLSQVSGPRRLVLKTKETFRKYLAEIMKELKSD